MNANGSTRSGAGSSSTGPASSFRTRIICRSRRPQDARTVLAMRQLPFRPRVVAGVAAGVALEVILVLGVSLPEGTRRAHPCDHLARPEPRGHRRRRSCPRPPDAARRRCRRSPSGSPNRGRALDGPWWSGRGSGRRRQGCPGRRSAPRRSGSRRPRRDPDGRVGRVLVLAAGVADPRRNHPVAVAKQLLHSPEAPPGEDRGLINHNCHVVLLRGRLFVDGTKPARRVGTSHQSEALGSLPGLRP